MRQYRPILVFCALVMLCAACGSSLPRTHLSEDSSVTLIAKVQGGVHGLTANNTGDVFYSDSFARGPRRVFRLKQGAVAAGGTSWPTGIEGQLPAGLEANGSYLWMCDTAAGSVTRFDRNFRKTVSLSATQPWNLAQLSDGSLLAVTYGGAVEKLRAGEHPQVLFTGLDAPFDIAADEDDHLWMSEQGAEGEGWVTLRRHDGSEVTRVGPFDNPEGLVLASDGTLWIADTGTGKIYRYHRSSGVLTLHTDKVQLPIVGTELSDGSVIFNGRMDGEYGLFRM